MIVDTFGGPSGWDEALKLLGRTDVLGIEWDDAACATRDAAGHATFQADVGSIDPAEMFAADSIEGVIGSPPCPTFSAAGAREGTAYLSQLCDHVRKVGRDGWSPVELVAQLVDDDEFGPQEVDIDPRTALVLEPLRYVLALEPEWVAFEQVPEVLPVWSTIAEVLRGRGYSAWAGVLSAEEYGVPQTRRRAFLMASRTRVAHPPEPTHQSYTHGQPAAEQVGLFGTLAPWVSMAEALGWGARDKPSATVTGGGTETGGADPIAHVRRFADGSEDWVVRTGQNSTQGRGETKVYERDVDSPAPTLTGQTRSWQVGFPRKDDTGTSDDGYRERDWRDCDDPAPTLTEKARSWKLRGVEVLGTCESCGAPAHVILPDNSRWCEACDESAERLGYEPPSGVNTGRDWRAHDGKPGRENAQVVPATNPAPAVTAKSGGQWQWTYDRPATTIAGDGIRTEELHLGLHGRDNTNSVGRSEDAIRISVEDALTLQSFRRDYPVQGGRTKQFEQVGNAVPPRLAAHVLAVLLGVELPAWE